MIKYRLVCDKEHSFDAWFASGDAFDEQQKLGLIACPYCDSTSIIKAPMAPGIISSKRRSNAKKHSDLIVQQSVALSQQRDPRKHHDRADLLLGQSHKDATALFGSLVSSVAKMPDGESAMHDLFDTAPHSSASSSAEEGVALQDVGPFDDDTAADEQHTTALVKKRQALKVLAQVVKDNFQDVGRRFSEEVRKMHYGETKKRNISGHASNDEIIDLIQEGIDVVPLPPLPKEDA